MIYTSAVARTAMEPLAAYGTRTVYPTPPAGRSEFRQKLARGPDVNNWAQLGHKIECFWLLEEPSANAKPFRFKTGDGAVVGYRTHDIDVVRFGTTSVQLKVRERRAFRP